MLLNKRLPAEPVTDLLSKEFQPICGTGKPLLLSNSATDPGTMFNPSTPPLSVLPSNSSCSPRQIPRNGLPDCMEAHVGLCYGCGTLMALVADALCMLLYLYVIFQSLGVPQLFQTLHGLTIRTDAWEDQSVSLSNVINAFHLQ